MKREVNLKDFNCIGCGLCCQNIHKVLDHPYLPEHIQELADEFPYKHTNGRCEMLQDDMSCAVYENRPIICDIIKSKYAFDPESTMEEYLAKQEVHCKTLMKQAGWSEKKIKEEYQKSKS